MFTSPKCSRDPLFVQFPCLNVFQDIQDLKGLSMFHLEYVDRRITKKTVGVDKWFNSYAFYPED